jgi:hypothetical protein
MRPPEISEVVNLHHIGSICVTPAVRQLRSGLNNLERPGGPCVYEDDDVLFLLRLVTEEPLDRTSRWTVEALRIFESHTTSNTLYSMASPSYWPMPMARMVLSHP